jgi:hypothetical protein
MSWAGTLVERQSRIIAANNFFISTLVLLGLFPTISEYNTCREGSVSFFTLALSR